MAKFYESIAVCLGLLLLAICIVPQTSIEAASTSLRLRRSVDNVSKVIKSSTACPASTPCGWAVYTPFSRTVDYFMQNTCVCETEDQCIRTEDDLSISAYVYRCRPKHNTGSPSS